jgi:hypothetical protein
MRSVFIILFLFYPFCEKLLWCAQGSFSSLRRLRPVTGVGNWSFLKWIERQFCIGEVFLDIHYHLRHSNGVIGVDIDVFHVVSTLYHILQHIIPGLSTHEIIVQADKTDGMEVANQESTFIISTAAIIGTSFRHRTAII